MFLKLWVLSYCCVVKSIQWIAPELKKNRIEYKFLGVHIVRVSIVS